MKKLALSFIVCVFIVFLVASFAYAEDNIVEVPNLKIIIDGSLTEQRDVAISVNQRTLLPLRELAEKLGVPNDDDHIIWNNQEKSVTIIKDSIKIYLVQGSKTVYVNDTPVELDVAPVGYTNSRTYIPFRFLAETFGKKVIWDGSTESIFVCDVENFDRVKEIMDKSDEAMKPVEKVSANYDIKADIFQNNLKIPIDMHMTTKIDTAAKAMYMLIDADIMGQKQISEVYYDEKYSYLSVMDAWIKQDLEEIGAQSMFDNSDNSDILGLNIDTYNDIFCSGLKIAETDEESDIVLEGDVYFGNLFETLSKNLAGMLQGEINVSDCHLRLSIDKDTYYVNEMAMQAKCYVSTVVEDIKFDMTMDMDMLVKFDYSEDLVVEIPEEVIDNAVDMNEFIEEAVEVVE